MMKGEVWLVELPAGKGHEQQGERPALVVGSGSGLAAVIPITSITESLRFPFTCSMEPGPRNGLDKKSVALVFQITTLDERRIRCKLGSLNKEEQNAVDVLLRSYLRLD